MMRVTVVHSTTIYITSNDRASSLMSDHILFCVEDDHYFVILRTTSLLNKLLFIINPPPAPDRQQQQMGFVTPINSLYTNNGLLD